MKIKASLSFCLLFSYLLSSCNNYICKIDSKYFSNCDSTGDTIMFENNYSFYIEGIAESNNLIIGYATMTYLRTVNGFPYRYFIISNNLTFGYHYCYMAIFDNFGNRVEPLYCCKLNSSEELIVYDLCNIENFEYGRYTTVSNLFFQYKDYYFNYFQFVKNINKNKLESYEQFAIRYS